MTYEQRMRIIGKLIDETLLRDVCITEYEQGVFIVGVSPVASGDQITNRPRTIALDNKTIERMAAEIQPTHADDESGQEKGSGWLGRRRRS